MQQVSIPETFEDFNDALREAVRHLGGFKKVGPKLWPEVLDEAAGNRLRDCLNPDRRDKLSPEQALLVLAMARKAGFHGAMAYVAFVAGYETPRTVEPEDQAEALQRAFMESVDKQAAILLEMRRFQQRRGA